MGSAEHEPIYIYYYAKNAANKHTLKNTVQLHSKKQRQALV